MVWLHHGLIQKIHDIDFLSPKNRHNDTLTPPNENIKNIGHVQLTRLRHTVTLHDKQLGYDLS